MYRHYAKTLFVLLVLVGLFGPAQPARTATDCSKAPYCQYLPLLRVDEPIQVLSASIFHVLIEGYKGYSYNSNYAVVRVQNGGPQPVRTTHLEGRLDGTPPVDCDAGPYIGELPYLLFPGEAATIQIHVGENDCVGQGSMPTFSVTQTTVAPAASLLTVLAATAEDLTDFAVSSVDHQWCAPPSLARSATIHLSH